MPIKLKPLSILFASINILCLVFLCFYKTYFWYDEAYSISMVNQSFREIWNITAHDVHPPLYYFILKIFTSVFGKSLTAMHFCSLLGVIGTLLLGFFPIKKMWGATTSFIFILLISVLPVILFLGIEIRMYSWLLFFILAAALFGYKTLTNESSKKSYFWFTFFAICASYTHNYGLASSLIIFGLLWILFFITHKEKKYLLIASLSFLIIFSFWIPNLYLQMTSVKESYWIKPPSLLNAAYYFLYFTSAKLTGIFVQAAHIIMIITILWIVYLCIVNRRKIDTKRILPSLFFMSIFAILFLSTLILSIVFKPILIDRYLISVLGCYIQSFAIFIPAIINISYKKLKIGGLIILACITSVYVVMFIDVVQNDTKDKARQDNVLAYVNSRMQENNKYTIIGLEQKTQIPMWSVLKPNYNYKYFFDRSEQSIEWITYPFDIQKINSLQNESNSVLFITDLLYKSDTKNKYPKSMHRATDEIQRYYTVTRTDTIDNVEFKVLTKK